MIKKAYSLEVENGKLTDNDFVGDTPPIGASDPKYSKADQEAFAELAAELDALKPKD